jgi:hypothetical protein
MQGRKCSIMPMSTLDIDAEGTNRRSRKTSLQPQSNLLSDEYKRRQSKKFSRSDPLHAQWYQTDQMRRISQTSINQNETRKSFSRSLENSRIKSTTRTPRNTRTSRNEQNETILEMNLIAEKLTKKLNEEN